MKTLLLLSIVPVLFLTGCETLTHREQTVLQEHQVSPYVYNKMMTGDPLTLPDIIELSHHGVPPGIVVDYIEQSDARYRLRPADVKRLRTAGVDEEIVECLLSTAPAYPAPALYGPNYYPYGPAWYPYDPYFYDGPTIFVGGGYGGWHRGGWGHGGGHRHH